MASDSVALAVEMRIKPTRYQQQQRNPNDYYPGSAPPAFSDMLT
jgi:hypothetical protein